MGSPLAIVAINEPAVIRDRSPVFCSAVVRWSIDRQMCSLQHVNPRFRESRQMTCKGIPVQYSHSIAPRDRRAFMPAPCCSHITAIPRYHVSTSIQVRGELCSLLSELPCTTILSTSLHGRQAISCISPVTPATTCCTPDCTLSRSSWSIALTFSPPSLIQVAQTPPGSCLSGL